MGGDWRSLLFQKTDAPDDISERLYKICVLPREYVETHQDEQLPTLMRINLNSSGAPFLDVFGDSGQVIKALIDFSRVAFGLSDIDELMNLIHGLERAQGQPQVVNWHLHIDLYRLSYIGMLPQELLAHPVSMHDSVELQRLVAHWYRENNEHVSKPR